VSRHLYYDFEFLEKAIITTNTRLYQRIHPLYIQTGVNLYESADGTREQRMADYIFKCLGTHSVFFWLGGNCRRC